ncbi:MAG: DUF4147 domain-containing protein [Candidatus Cloacimonetes bacterium]|nr:DUF4147 domain-containing protein [Candidatus Cloacimonadota bacterium]
MNDTENLDNLKKNVLQIAEKAVASVLPEYLLPKHLKNENYSDGIVMLAIGKAAWTMADAAARILKDKLISGICITKYGGSRGEIQRVEIHEAGHPIPDNNSLLSVQKTIRLLESYPDRKLVVLLSGGASALFEKPSSNLTQDYLADLTNKLIYSSASITEINTLRKFFSDVKGGKFLSLIPQKEIDCYFLSDVIGDDLSVIGSGIFFCERIKKRIINDILKKYKIETTLLPSNDHLLCKRNKNVRNILIGNNLLLQKNAIAIGEEHGFNTIRIDIKETFEVSSAANYFIEIINRIKSENEFRKPVLVVAGGELTINAKKSGKGGRNQHLALEMATKISGATNIVFAAVASDGDDGNSEAAGGIIDGNTQSKATLKGFSLNKTLSDFNSYYALKAVGGLIEGKLSGTNVNDLYLIAIT